MDGVLIVGRAPAKQRHVSDFLPCHFCLQFFKKRELYRHARECKFRDPDSSLDSAVLAGRTLLHGSISDDVDKSLMEIVIFRMRDDKITAVAKSDHLILQYGTMLLHKLGEKRALDISARMRELARIVISLRSSDASASLNSCISGQGFDRILAAIEVEAKPQTGPGGRRIFGKPAFVVKVGSSLVKCAQLKRGVALREGDSVAVKEVEDFWRFTTVSTQTKWHQLHMLHIVSRATLCVNFPMRLTCVCCVNTSSSE